MVTTMYRRRLTRPASLTRRRPCRTAAAPRSFGNKTPTRAIGKTSLRLPCWKKDTVLLAVSGARACEVKLVVLPADHQICRLLAAVKGRCPTGPNRPTRAFKRSYELSLAEPLRLEWSLCWQSSALFVPNLGKTWATYYAPMNTEQQRRLHRTVLLLLVRSRLTLFDK